MATDVKRIISNLLEFYDFNNKTIISVGAGGGQFVEYGRYAKRVIAIDNDEEALIKLKDSLLKVGLEDKFTLVNSDFLNAGDKGDIVLFEFSLHEMKDTIYTVKHALTMASNVLVADHWPNSDWAYIVDEKEKVINSWEALRSFTFKKVQRFDTFQFFRNYDEIYQKVRVQGENSINRIEKYKEVKDFSIPMSYGFALI